MTDVIDKDDSRYPKLLKQIKNAPKQLYYKGKWDDNIFKNCLAVVGSRRLTSYGKRAIEQIISKVALSGVTIVSGFMYGGDAAAHQTAVKAGGQTIAVMPCGIERIHPEYQKKLYFDILDNNGLIISEYKGDTQPVLWTYPQRNRIVAGLSRAILVAEAGIKSGSLITAEYAQKFGRKVFALPGPITSSVSQGTNFLIKQGAEMVSESNDILKYFSLETKDTFEKEKNQDVLENNILQVLNREPLTIDELSRNLQMPSSELGIKLSMMEIQGQVLKQEGKYYVNYQSPRNNNQTNSKLQFPIIK